MELRNKRIIVLTLIVIIIILLMLLSFYLGRALSEKTRINDKSSASKKAKISPTPDLSQGNTDNGQSKKSEKEEPVIGDRYFQFFRAKSGIEGQYHLYGNMRTDSNTGLMIYLHGDGAEDFDNGVNSESLNKLMNAGKKNNLLPVAVKTPSFDLTWWKDGVTNAKYLNDFFIEYLFSNFNLNKERVLLVGYSGGSELITEFFMLDYAQNLFKGATILFGGGSVQYSYDSNIMYSENFKKLFKIHYYTGTNDFMYEKAKYAARFFSKEGFNVSAQYPKGEDHYNLPMDTVVSQQLKKGILTK
jgi:predicted peptidase